MHSVGRMKSIIIFLVIIQLAVCLPRNVTNSIFKAVYADECELGEFPINEIPIDVTDVEFKEFKSMANFGAPEIDTCGVGGNPEVVEGIEYIEVIPKETSIELKPKKMDELEENTESTPSSLLLCIKMKIPGCVREDDDRLYLKVADTNNHDPEIIGKDGKPTALFEFKVPMPLPARINLYDFGDTIFAKDIDFSNKGLKLSITGDDLEFKYVAVQPGTKNKVHTTKLVVSKALSFPVREYTITVEDSGVPPRHTEATIKVVRDEDLSVTNPHFENALYSAIYDGEKLVHDKIILNDGKGAEVTILEKEYKDYFEDISNPSNGEIILEIVKNLFDKIKKKSLTITLTANVVNQIQPAKTTIYIDMKNNQPKFKKAYYEGSYNGAIDMEPIIWENWMNADVIVFPEENNRFFKVTKKNEKIEVGLEEVELFTGTSITVTLGAYVERADVILDETVIKINLEDKNIQFDKMYYKATYDGDVLHYPPIELLNGVNAEIDILETGYKDYFEHIPSPPDGIIILKIVNEAFTENKEQSLTITLTASVANQPQAATTTIYIEMESNQPKFDKPYYEGSYNGELVMDPITWKNWKNADVTVFPEAIREFFKATKNDGIIEVSFDNLKNYEGTSISITLKASVESEEYLDETVIKINLINKQIKFMKNYYEGNFDGEHLNVDKIMLENGDTAHLYILEDEYYEYFDKNNDKGVVELIPKGLENIQESSITITLLAYIESKDNSAKTVIKVKLEKKQIQFQENYYEGTYNEQDQLTIGPINLLNGEKAKIDFVEEGSDNFVTAENDKGKIKLSLKNIKDFPKSILQVTLRARIETEEAKTTLNIILENKQLKFMKNYYEGNFDGEHLNMEDITLENGDTAHLYILEDEYYKFFDKNNDKGVVHLTPKGLENIQETSIAITLLAYIESKDNSAKTVIKVKLEKKQIQFEENYYEGNYNEQDQLTIGPINLLNGENAKIDFLEPGYDNFVTADNNKGEIKLSLKNIKDFQKSILQVTLIARIGSDEAKTTVNIILENKQLKFMKNYYEGNFDGEHLTMDSSIMLENGDSAELDILEGDYTKYFDPNNNEGVVDLRPKNLDLINEPSITINLVASIKTEDISTQTVIKIILNTKELRFKENYYEGTYKKPNIVMEEIMLVNGATAKLDILEEEGKYFNKKNTNGLVELSFKETENFKETFIKITLTATVGATVAKTTVNIKLENNFLKFNQALYEAHYKNSKLTAPKITLLNADDTEFKILEADYEKYFGISNTKSNVIIEPNEILKEEDKSAILITVRARQKNDQKNIAETTINIYLDDNVKYAYFEKPLYIGTSDDGQSLSIKDIKIIDGNIVTCSIIDEDYEKYFKVTFNKNNLVEIELNDGENLNKIEESTITLTLEANVEHQSKSATTAIQINLIKKKLQFEKPFHEGYYIGGNLIIDSINLQNGKSAKVDVIDSEFSKYFVATNINGVVTIELNPDEDLSSEKVSTISLAIMATDGTNIAQAAVQIELKDKETPLEPEFEEPYYEATFDGTKLEIDEIILPSGGKIDILEDAYRDLFEIDIQDNKAKITAKNELNKIKEPSIVVTLVASWKRKLVTSKAIVHIILEKNMNNPHFKELKYEGNFDGKDLKIDGSIEMIGGEIEDAKISDKEYGQYFKVEYKDNIVTIGLAGDLSLIHKPFIIFTLEATAQGFTAKTVIQITLNNYIISPSFESNFYKGKFDGDKLEVNAIKLIGGTIDRIEILEPEYQFFTIKDEGGKIQITVIEDEKENLNAINEPYIVVTLVATVQTQVAKTAVLIELKKSIVTTTTPTGEASTETSSGGSSSDETSGATGYIVAVAVLAVLLCIFICGAGGFWYFKLRNKSTFEKFDNNSEDGVATTENKAVNFVALEEPEFDTTPSQRRPTGFVFHPPPPEDDEDEDEDDDSSSSDESKSSSSISKSKGHGSDDDTTDTDEPDTPRSLDRRKSVTFIENIDKIEIERSHDNDDDDDDKEEEHNSA